MLRSKLIDDLIASVKTNNAGVKDVRVGISWTGVYGNYCGLSKTYGIPVKHKNYTRNMGNLTQMTTLELAEYAQSWNLVEASIGVAAIMAMIPPEPNAPEFNAEELILEKGNGKKVVMVGAFPFIDKLRAVAKEFYILELDPSFLDPNNNIIPATASEYLIPESELLVVTGSALINKSLERILTLASENNTYTVILGPSTIMSEVFFDYGADVLAGSEVLKPEAILRKISQSGGMIDSKSCPGEITFRVMMK